MELVSEEKMATELAPFIMDPEKAIDAWNQTYPSDTIPSDPTAMAALINVDNKNKLHILSGKTIGSSFVGLVHFEQHENTNSSQTFKLACEISNDKRDNKPPVCPFKIDVCFRSNVDQFFFSCPFLIMQLYFNTQ